MIYDYLSPVVGVFPVCVRVRSAVDQVSRCGVAAFAEGLEIRTLTAARKEIGLGLK